MQNNQKITSKVCMFHQSLDYILCVNLIGIVGAILRH
jgi:hypothetical protein